MALVTGTPSIRLEGDERRALALIPEGRLLLAKAQEFATHAGVPTFSMSRRVDEDSYIYVLIAGGQNIIQISSRVIVPDRVYETPEDPDPNVTPDFLSGIVTNGTIIKKTGTRDDGTKFEYDVVAEWAPTNNCAIIQGLNAGRQTSSRLSVRPHNSMSELASKVPAYDFSQYVSPRASMWSGTMKKVVQVVMGLGRIGKNKLKDPMDPTAPPSAFMTQVAGNGVQLQYDYKFIRTHGIYKGPDGVLWLVEISSSKGVIAMPLPIFPGSNTEAFKLRANRRGDVAMERALDELGCLPTGEAFPIGERYWKMIENGDILRLMLPAELNEFYRLSGYSSACGWAFSDRGNEAHNVAYHWPEDDVFQRGFWYQIIVNIGAVNLNRKAGDPIAVGVATLVKQREGYLYSPPVKNSFIPVKYFEPLLPGLLSHTAKPTGPSADVVNCNTPVFVGFMNGDLKVGFYFRMGQTQTVGEYTDDRAEGECLLEGSWTWETRTGYRSLPAMPYTNDIDPREIMDDSVVTATLTSNSIGYDPPKFSDFLQAPDTCFVWRDKVYRQTTVRETRTGHMKTACFVVPGFAREAYYYFEGMFFTGGRSGSTNVEYAFVRDPYTYYGWRKFPQISAPPWPSGYGCSFDKCGGMHSDRRIVCEVFDTTNYSGPWTMGGGSNDCRSYADSGPWADECQDVRSLAPNAPPNHVATVTSWNKGQDFTGTWNFFSDGLFGPASGTITKSQLDYAMAPSPDPDTQVIQFIYGEHSAIGEDCVIYTKGFNGDRVVTGYTPITLSQNDGMPTFIGVNTP